MNTFQQQLTGDILKALEALPHCICVVLTGDLALSEGDDFSPVSLCVLMDGVGAHDLLHTREQFMAQFGPVLSFLYPSNTDSDLESFEAIYDQEVDNTIVRITVCESSRPEVFAEALRESGYSILFERKSFALDLSVPDSVAAEQHKASLEHMVTSIWHALPGVARSIQRGRVPEAIDGYVLLMSALADLARPLHATGRLNGGLTDASIDFDQATTRSIESLTEDVRFVILSELLESYCDLLEKITAELVKKFHISAPSKTVVRRLRNAFLV